MILLAELLGNRHHATLIPTAKRAGTAVDTLPAPQARLSTL